VGRYGKSGFDACTVRDDEKSIGKHRQEGAGCSTRSMRGPEGIDMISLPDAHSDE
jgi:hypothetical protein